MHEKHLTTVLEQLQRRNRTVKIKMKTKKKNDERRFLSAMANKHVVPIFYIQRPKHIQPVRGNHQLENFRSLSPVESEVN